MDEKQINDWISFKEGNSKKLNSIYLDYIEIYSDRINKKLEKIKWYVCELEIKADVVLAVNATFCKITNMIEKSGVKAIDIDFDKIFTTFFEKFIKINKRDNLPLRVMDNRVVEYGY